MLEGPCSPTARGIIPTAARRVPQWPVPATPSLSVARGPIQSFYVLVLPMLVIADRVVLAHLERRAEEQVSELLSETSGLLKATRRSIDDLARATGDVDAARQAVEAKPEAAKALPPEVGQQVSKASPRKLGDLSEKVSEFVRFSRSVLEHLEQQATELSSAAQAAQKKGVLARASGGLSGAGKVLKAGAAALRDQVAKVRKSVV